MPHILLTNDDGIRSPGLLILKKKLETLGKLTIVAPKTEKSGVGKAVSTATVKVAKTVFEGGAEAYAVEGTPADAVLLALFKILEKPPDIVVSGINLGPNLGIDDLLTSGTLGAAFEAAIHGIPAVAVSYCIEKINEARDKDGTSAAELEPAADLTREIVEYVLEFGMPPEVDVLSINVPAKGKAELIEFTRPSYKGYVDIFRKHREGYRIHAWILDDYPDDEKGTDIYAIKHERQVSLTPIKLEFIHSLEDLAGLADFLRNRGYAIR